jgi:hypothetical protein
MEVKKKFNSIIIIKMPNGSLCSYKPRITRDGKFRNSCVKDKKALFMDPSCKYDYITSKCIINTDNIPVKSKNYKRVRKVSKVSNIRYSPMKCSMKTKVTRDGKIKNLCVNDKYAYMMDPRCSVSYNNRCIVDKDTTELRLRRTSNYNYTRALNDIDMIRLRGYKRRSMKNNI